jgi:hypothetical protein
MLRSIRGRLTYANVTASVALFVALGGASYAATQLPKNSVGSAQIKPNAVTKSDIARNAVTGSKVKPRTLDGTDINVAKLGTVPSAERATTAAGIARVTYKSAVATIPGYSGTGPLPRGTATATCDAGESVLGGGIDLESDTDQLVYDSHPSGTYAWTGLVYNLSGAPHKMTVTAICAPVRATG